MPSAGFETVIPASEWPQTHTLDRTATAIGSKTVRPAKNRNGYKQFFIILVTMQTKTYFTP